MSNPHKNLNEEIKSWAIRSTFHGLPNIITSDRISIKILWSICFLVSAGYCGKVLVTSVTNYWNYDVDTVIEILRDTNADFPTVTFCSLHVCGLDAYNVSKLLESYANRTRNESGTSNTWTTANLRTLFEIIGDEYLRTSDRNDLLRVLKSNKTSIRYNLISCQYSSEFCYENDFEYFELNDFQKCYRFNSGFDFNGEKSDIRKARRYGNITLL